jgi:signal transduction histidine kinase
VTQAEAAGLRTALSVVGDVAEAPLAVSQAGYRIVQESLTNVVRHADATRASILVECVGGLRLRVVDDGRGAPLGFSDGSGNGLPGMRERATAFGGELTAGPLPSGGFRVAAYIPFPPTTRTDSMATHTDTGTDTDTGTGTEEHP